MRVKPFPKLSREFFGKCECKQGRAAVRVVTYHGTQGSTARGGAVTLTTRSDGSAHEVHDAREGFKLAEDETILCHVGGANTGNYGIEDATFAAWTRKLWFLHKRTLKWSAYRVAHILRKHKLPNDYLNPLQVERAGSILALKGWTYHVNLSRATWCGSTHTDPGAFFPRNWFRRYVTWYYRHPHVNVPVTLNRKGQRKARRHR